MPDRIIRSTLTLFAIVVVSATIALAQSPASSGAQTVTDREASDTWQAAQLAGPSKGRIFVVTIDQPDRRQTCHIQSFTLDKLVCSRAVGGPRTYFPQQVAALILPGDGRSKLAWVLGLNGGLAAAIWGTVVLAAICPACAAATGVVALALFCGAGGVLIGDDQPNRLLYLAAGQQLSGKLGYVQR